MRQPLQEMGCSRMPLRNEQAATIGGSVNGGKNAEYKGRFKVFTSCRIFLIYLELNPWSPGIWIAIWEKLF